MIYLSGAIAHLIKVLVEYIEIYNSFWLSGVPNSLSKDILNQVILHIRSDSKLNKHLKICGARLGRKCIDRR